MHTLQRIGYVVVFVRDWDGAMRFYADLLGLEVVTRRDGGGFAEFRFPSGGPNLLVEQVDKADIEARALVGQFVGMSVTARDVRHAYEHLSTRGVRFEAAPSRQSWGGMLAHFYDPDGNMWSLVEEAAGYQRGPFNSSGEGAARRHRCQLNNHPSSSLILE